MPQSTRKRLRLQPSDRPREIRRRSWWPVSSLAMPWPKRQLVARYYRVVRAVLRQLLRGRDDAEDLLQETFRLAIEKLRDGQLKQPSRLPSFLISLARNLAINQFRIENRRQTDADSGGGRATRLHHARPSRPADHHRERRAWSAVCWRSSGPREIAKFCSDSISPMTTRARSARIWSSHLSTSTGCCIGRGNATSSSMRSGSDDVHRARDSVRE